MGKKRRLTGGDERGERENKKEWSFRVKGKKKRNVVSSFTFSTSLQLENESVLLLISLPSLASCKPALNSPPSPGHPGARQPGGVVGRDAAPRTRGGELRFRVFFFSRKRSRRSRKSACRHGFSCFHSIFPLFSLSSPILTKSTTRALITPSPPPSGRRRR